MLLRIAPEQTAKVLRLSQAVGAAMERSQRDPGLAPLGAAAQFARTRLFNHPALEAMAEAFTDGCSIYISCGWGQRLLDAQGLALDQGVLAALAAASGIHAGWVVEDPLPWAASLSRRDLDPLLGDARVLTLSAAQMNLALSGIDLEADGAALARADLADAERRRGAVLRGQPRPGPFWERWTREALASGCLALAGARLESGPEPAADVASRARDRIDALALSKELSAVVAPATSRGPARF